MTAIIEDLSLSATIPASESDLRSLSAEVFEGRLAGERKIHFQAYSAGAPAPYEIRDAFCMTAGEKVMELIAKNIRPRDIVTRRALENAAAVVAAVR